MADEEAFLNVNSFYSAKRKYKIWANSSSGIIWIIKVPLSESVQNIKIHMQLLLFTLALLDVNKWSLCHCEIDMWLFVKLSKWLKSRSRKLHSRSHKMKVSYKCGQNNDITFCSSLWLCHLWTFLWRHMIWDISRHLKSAN